MKQIETDIIVIGGGLAGMVAALSAKAEGSRVTLICKSLAGHSGNSIVAGAGVSVYYPRNGQNDTVDLFRGDLFCSGAGINDPRIVDRILVSSSEVLPFLRDNGVKFRLSGEDLMVKRVGGHSTARFYYTDYSDKCFQTRGLSITEPVSAAVERAEIGILNRASVIRLLMTDDRISGCICIDNQSGERFAVLAKSVVLAAGGGASLFERTNNTADVTCDSYRLALEAGARLRDMEYVQFYPCVLSYPIRMQLEGSLFADGAVLRNTEGEAFMRHYSAKGDLATRDEMAFAVQSEINAGRGRNNCIFVDCSGINEEAWRIKYREFTSTLQNHHIDVRKDWLMAAPAAHFYMGGICVDGDYSAGVPGLFACGEAVGGLHGANRLPGVALTEAVISGGIAGRKAAEHAKDVLQEDRLVIPDTEAAAFGTDWKQEIRKLRTMAWKEVSIIRDEASIDRFEHFLEERKEMIEGAKAGREENRRAYEYLSYYMTGRMLAMSAKARKESRGAHYRSDHPDKDEAFSGNYICSLNEKGEIGLGFMKCAETAERKQYLYKNEEKRTAAAVRFFMSISSVSVLFGL